MIEALHFILLATVGALLNRIRGGWDILKFRRAVSMTLIGIVVSIISFCYGMEWWSLLNGPLFVGMLSFGWGCSMDMGRNKNAWKQDTDEIYSPVLKIFFGEKVRGESFQKRWRRDFAGLLIRGMMISLPVGLLTGYVTGNYWYIPIGLTMPLCYETGYRIPVKNRGPEIAEFIFGAVLFGGFIVLS